MSEPHKGVEGLTPALDLHHHRRSIRGGGANERERLNVTRTILFLLPPRGRNALAEVSVCVKQPHADSRNPEIRRALQVVPGEYAKPTRVQGQRFVETEFRRKVCDGRSTEHAGSGGAPRVVVGQLLLKTVVVTIDTALE